MRCQLGSSATEAYGSDSMCCVHVLAYIIRAPIHQDRRLLAGEINIYLNLLFIPWCWDKKFVPQYLSGEQKPHQISIAQKCLQQVEKYLALPPIMGD